MIQGSGLRVRLYKVRMFLVSVVFSHYGPYSRVQAAATAVLPVRLKGITYPLTTSKTETYLMTMHLVALSVQCRLHVEFRKFLRLGFTTVCPFSGCFCCRKNPHTLGGCTFEA